MYFIGACLVGVTSTFCPLGFKTEMQIESQPEVIGRTFAASRFMILLFRMAGSLMVGQILKICNIRIVWKIKKLKKIPLSEDGERDFFR